MSEELEDMFNTKEFKELSWATRFWLRVKVAFFQTIKMM
jgi:hypothetical protein